MERLGIEHLSVFGLPPVAFVELAADLGAPNLAVGLFSMPDNPFGYPAYSLRDDAALRREMKAAMRDRGVAIVLGEGFVVRPGAGMRERARDVEVFAELGARRLNTVSMDPDLGRSFDEFAVVAEMAAAAGMESSVEFGPGLGTPDLATALAAVRHVGRPDFKLLIDTMHLARTGGTAADLAALDPALIGHIQLSDSLKTDRFATYMEEAMYERMAPGDGELPLVDILAALPRHLNVGLEIPLRSEALAGVGPGERLGRCVAAARTVLAKADAKSSADC